MVAARLCIRCKAEMQMNYDEPICPTCGWVDYEYVAPGVEKSQRGVFSSATLFLVRYSGEVPKFKGKVITVRVIYRGPVGERGAGRPAPRPAGGPSTIGYQPNCPFCIDTVWMVAGAHNKKEAKKLRFSCIALHKINLDLGELEGSGVMTWM